MIVILRMILKKVLSDDTISESGLCILKKILCVCVFFILCTDLKLYVGII